MRPRSLPLLACLLAAVVAVVGVVAWASADVAQVGGRLTWVPRFHLAASEAHLADVAHIRAAQGAGAVDTNVPAATGRTASPERTGSFRARFRPSIGQPSIDQASIGVAHDDAIPPGPHICAVVPLRHAATKATGRRLWMRKWTLARRLLSTQRQPAARTGPAPTVRRAGHGPRRRRPTGRTRAGAARRSRAADQPRQPRDDDPNRSSTESPRTPPWPDPVPVALPGLAWPGLGAPDAANPPNAELDQR